jgi:hypothetical protein
MVFFDIAGRRREMRRNHRVEILNSKSQIPNKLQISNNKKIYRYLEFVI